ncbi:MAG TPA: hypothetical protein PKA28_01170 [Methylomusa anaerophila]|uniref:Uncharacterized protein n=1 Tax=Methylomusa anaerophila TaxID=1930071 RepID=A0A348APX8_9FIRM|nr:hypothetical protein [Methylomusa anaerophila]BBB93126.1 hypothetical protein MAMMFC1_03835 [Methylomusa anaerophila]HML87041.1 hypothetical protein [Methylomusa anaerophila]
MYTWGALLAVCLLSVWSIWLRICRSRVNSGGLPSGIEPKPTPLSTAVQDLVATAGGIYISLVMIVSFLKLNIPNIIGLGEFSFDPLAVTAISLAIVQPLVARVIDNIS